MTTHSAWTAPVTHYIQWLQAGDVRKATISLRKYQLSRIGTRFTGRSPWQLSPEDLAGWLSEHDWSRETLRSYVSALRGFYGWARAGGHTENDPSRLLRPVPPAKHKPRPAGETDIDGALGRAHGKREWLMLMLGSRQGLRRGEISRVHTDDVFDDGTGWCLRVHGKGGKVRDVPLLNEIAAVLRAKPAGWVFPSSTRPGQPISPAYCGKLISRALPKAVVPHQLRHRFGTVTFRSTGNIRAVQELLGHASVATTQTYTAVTASELRDAIQTAA